MANIKGITIELNGDTTGLSKALAGVNKDLKDTQAKLRDVEKALKVDPSNMELLQQKQKYLGDAISDTEKKLRTEKEALEQLNLRAASGEDVTDQQEALQREIVETEGSLKKLQEQSEETGKSMAGDFDEAGKKAESLGDKIKSAGEDIESFGSGMKEVGSGISSVGSSIDQNISEPLKRVASASVEAWHEVDDAMDTVTTKTGATGDALADMQKRAKNIAATIPASFQEAGDAVGEVNTRFGLTGDALEDLATDFIKFAQLNDADVSPAIDSVQAAMAAMNVETKDAPKFLDTLNKAGQDTGISVTGLADDLSKNGAALNDMGYSASDATFFLANLSKNGVDSSTVITGLKAAFKNSAKEGKSMSDTLAEFNGVMASGKPETEKMQAAIDLFGSKGGAAIYQYCSQGKLNFQDLGTAMSDYAGNVNATWEETKDPLDEMTVVQNNLKEVGADLVDTAGPMLVDIMHQIIPVIQNLKEGWESLPDGMQQFIVQAGLVGMATGPVVTQIGNVTTSLGGIIEGSGKVIGKFGELIGKSGETGTALGNVVSGGGSKLVTFLNSDVSAACSSMSGTLGTAGAVVATFAASFEFTQAILQLTGLDEKLEDTGGRIYDFFHKADEEAAAASNSALQHATEAIQGTYPVEQALQELDTAIAQSSGNEQESLQKLRDAMVQKYGEGAQASSKAAETASTSMQTMGSATQNAAGTIRSAMSTANSSVSAGVGSMQSKINGANFSFPHIKIPHFGVSGSFSLDPPRIPQFSVSWYKKAMDDAYILSSPTIFGATGGKLLGGGEAGQEAVVGTKKLAEIVQGALASASGGDIIIPVYIGQEKIDEIVVRATQRSNYRSGGR